MLKHMKLKSTHVNDFEARRWDFAIFTLKAVDQRTFNTFLANPPFSIVLCLIT